MALWLLAIPVVGVPAWPGGQWLWIVSRRLALDLGTLLFAWGYARGPASYLAVTEYSGFLWASALGWLVFHETRVALHARRRGADRRRLPRRRARQARRTAGDRRRRLAAARAR